MKNRKDYNLGIMFRREHAPENLPNFARRAEEAGFDELWVVEDCFYGSGIASLGILSQVHDYVKEEGRERLEAAMPDAWIDQLSIAGSPEAWDLAIRRLVEAGANTVVLTPLPGKGLDALDVFARHLLQ